jgi:phosphoglycolate phosphatase
MDRAELLFDLDGTLSDPIEGIWRSINYALESIGHPTLDVEVVRNYVGPPIDQTFTRITGLTSSSDVSTLVAKYRERYSDIGYSENVLYPEVKEALRSLSERGMPMGVCTSKRKDFAERILELFALRSFFIFIDGGDVGIEKWQQIAALRASSRIGTRSLMIGDRAVDLVAAHRNGLRSGAVLWGYGSSEELMSEEPEYVFRAPNEWLQLTVTSG